MNKKTYNINENVWIIIAVILFLFPPVGLLATIVRCALEKKYHEYGKDYILQPAVAAISVSLFEIFLMFVIGMESGTGKTVVPIIAVIYGMSIVGGAIMLVTRRYYIRSDELSDLCVTIIEKGYLVDTKEIAECMALSVEKSEKLIKSLIAKRTLSGYDLDESKHLLIVKSPYKYYRCICNSCGADQLLMRGRDIVCQYCGSPTK